MSLSDPGLDFESRTLQHLQDTGPELVDEVDSRVAADRGTKIVESH